jgi:hypothetical protein
MRSLNWKGLVAALGCALATFALEGSQAAHAGSPTDACSLLTSAQVTAVLGVSVAAGEKLVSGSEALCGWAIPGQKTPNRKRVVLSIYIPLGGLTPIERFNNAKTPIPGITKEPVSGVGDEALFALTPGLGTGLIFRKGESAFDLRVYGFPKDQIKAKEKELADCVIQKLTNGRFTGDCPG